MAAVLTPTEFALAKKIAAMLSAEDAIAAIALTKLKKLAADKKIRVDELLGMLNSSGQQSNSSRPPPWEEPFRPRPPHQEGADYRYTDASYTDKSTADGDRKYAEEVRRAHQQKQQRAREAANMKAHAEAQARQAEQQKQAANLASRMETLANIPEPRLSSWEQSFRSSVIAQWRGITGWRPSEAQNVKINQILESRL